MRISVHCAFRCMLALCLILNRFAQSFSATIEVHRFVCMYACMFSSCHGGTAVGTGLIYVSQDTGLWKSRHWPHLLILVCKEFPRWRFNWIWPLKVFHPRLIGGGWLSLISTFTGCSCFFRCSKASAQGGGCSNGHAWSCSLNCGTNSHFVCLFFVFVFSRLTRARGGKMCLST